MKRINVSPDLLSSMTANALFAGSPHQRPAGPVDPKRGSVFNLGRWFKPAPAASGATKLSRAPSLTLDDDWVGGWYARTRLLQAATLAQSPGHAAKSANSTTSDGDGAKKLVDVVTQIKDFS